jgi:hypothetical protein
LPEIQNQRNYMNKMLFLAVAVGLLILFSAPTQPTGSQENSRSDLNQTVSLAAIPGANDVSENEASISPVLHSRITGLLAGVGLIVFVVANSKPRERRD